MPNTDAGDARIEAFCKLDVPGVFNAVVSPTQIWQRDVYDVETIHADARDLFARLLNAATTDSVRGRILLLMGEAGSGKTHLMRAFRATAHDSRQAHFGYLQLTTAAASYERYLLSNLINSMETPYYPPGVTETGLQRLSTATLDAVTDVSPEAAEHFRNGAIPQEDVPKVVRQWTERLIAMPRFQGVDEDLVAAMLYLQRNDPVVRNKALKWLRCENLSAYDQSFIGDLTPRPTPDGAAGMIKSLAMLMRLVQNAALVLCLDQLEDVFDQDSGADRFKQVVNLLVAMADEIPNGIFLLSCLEDYFKAYEQRLNGPKLDRINHDPAPVRLASPRTLDEIRAMVALRVASLYEAAGLEVEEGTTFPYTDVHLKPLESLGTRKVLQFLQSHHDRCAAAGQWVEPDYRSPATTTPPPVGAIDFDREWNDAASTASAGPDNEKDLAALLARAVGHCNVEIPADYAATTSVDGNLISIDRRNHPAGTAIVVAVCEKSAQGGGLSRQVAEVARRASGRSVVLVRSTQFPGARAKVSIEIGKVLGTTGRRVQVSDTDWRAMAAFDGFADRHKAVPAFADWQSRAKPLGQLQSIQTILDLKSIPDVRPVAKPPDRQTNIEPVPKAKIADAIKTADDGQPVPEVKVGITRELMPTPVFLNPEDVKRHMAFIGGSGSGKTTIALRIIEHLLGRGVPCVLLDRKGDLARYADPAAWDQPDDPAHPTHGPRRKWLRDHLDVDLFTPGSGDKGRPLSLPLVPVDLGTLSDTDRDEVSRFAAESIGGMMQFDARKDSDQAMLAILGKAIDVLAVAGHPVNIPALKDLIASMDPTLINAVGGYDVKRYKKLAESLLTLQLRNARLLTGGDGEKLDLDRMFGRSTRPRLTIINTQSLGDGGIDFWVSQFLVSVFRWQARSPSPVLRGVLFLDEADQYLPANRKPATKAPLESLLKRARSAGLGIMLATQAPGDLDYKGRDNILTWLIGLVKESNSINKLKPMLLSARGDVADKLPTQSVGEFFYVREGHVTTLKAGLSLVRTEQLPIDQVLRLASAGAGLDGGRSTNS